MILAENGNLFVKENKNVTSDWIFWVYDKTKKSYVIETFRTLEEAKNFIN